MARFITAAKNFVKGEEGATMVEYAIMVALIAIVSILIIGALGVAVSGVFNRINGQVSPLVTGGAPAA